MAGKDFAEMASKYPTINIPLYREVSFHGFAAGRMVPEFPGSRFRPEKSG
jgi:hypothetical protein